MSTTISRDYSQMPIGTADNQYAMGSSNSNPIIVGHAPDGSIAGAAGLKGADGKLYPGVLLRKIISGATLSVRLVRLESVIYPQPGRSFGLVKAWHGHVGAFVQSIVWADANGDVRSQVYYYHPPVVELPEGKMITEGFRWGYLDGEPVVVNVADPRGKDLVPLKVDGQWTYYENRIDTDVITWTFGDHVGVFDIPLVAEAVVYTQADVWHGNSWTKLLTIELSDDSEVPPRTAAERAEIARLIKAGNDRRAELERQRVEAARAKRLADRQAEAARIRAEQAAAREAKRKAKAEEAKKRRESGI